jgi:hypothetical protein
MFEEGADYEYGRISVEDFAGQVSAALPGMRRQND